MNPHKPLFPTVFGRGHIEYLLIYHTLPETKSSNLNIGGWNTTFLLGSPMFRCELLVFQRVIFGNFGATRFHPATSTFLLHWKREGVRHEAKVKHPRYKHIWSNKGICCYQAFPLSWDYYYIYKYFFETGYDPCLWTGYDPHLEFQQIDTSGLSLRHTTC